MGLPQTDVVTLPADPIQLLPTYDAALAAFEALPQVRVLFDNGAGPSPTRHHDRRRPLPRVRADLLVVPDPGHRRPAPGTSGRGGTLGDDAADRARASTRSPPTRTRFRSPTTATNTGTGGLWGNASQWEWNWQQHPAGTAVSYVSAPLTANTTVVGGGAVNLWVKSSTPDVDLQATISEVRPDGNETFVQNGWIRASERKLSTDSNNMFKQSRARARADPDVHRGRRRADAGRPVRQGRRSRSTTRATRTAPGSRIRVTIAAPNGTQPIWSFGQTRAGPAPREVSIAFSTTMPSSLVLPVVPASACRPPCRRARACATSPAGPTRRSPTRASRSRPRRRRPRPRRPPRPRRRLQLPVAADTRRHRPPSPSPQTTACRAHRGNVLGLIARRVRPGADRLRAGSSGPPPPFSELTVRLQARATLTLGHRSVISVILRRPQRRQGSPRCRIATTSTTWRHIELVGCGRAGGIRTRDLLLPKQAR